MQCGPLVRSAFCPDKIDPTSGLTSYPGYKHLQKLALHPEKPYISGPYKRAALYRDSQKYDTAGIAKWAIQIESHDFQYKKILFGCQ